MVAILRALLFSIFIAVLTACQRDPMLDASTPQSGESKKMTNNVSIRLGEPAAAFVKRYPNTKLLRQPAGLDFYSIDWDEPPRGVVTIEHGKNTFVIHDVLSVSTSEDQAEFKDEGFFSYNVNAGVTAPDKISHDEARLKIYAVLQGILNAGWRQVIERSEPRLKGRARQEYMFASSNLNGLDATYLPTFKDWMLVQSHTPWSFYADGEYLEVSFTREPTLTDPAKPGSYLLTFNLQTETEYFRGYAGPDNRLRWKEVVPQELVKVAALRAAKEVELRAQGVAIDESYEDPPVPSMR